MTQNIIDMENKDANLKAMQELVNVMTHNQKIMIDKLNELSEIVEFVCYTFKIKETRKPIKIERLTYEAKEKT